MSRNYTPSCDSAQEDDLFCFLQCTPTHVALSVFVNSLSRKRSPVIYVPLFDWMSLLVQAVSPASKPNP